MRVFTCACGKVQAGSLRGLELVQSKWHGLVTTTRPYHPRQGAPQVCYATGTLQRFPPKGQYAGRPQTVEAYGWKSDLSDEEVLEKLLAMN